MSAGVYGYRAKVLRLHIAKDNLKGISDWKKKMFSPWQSTSLSARGEWFLLSLRLRVSLICKAAHIWVVLRSRLENWRERERSSINLSSYQNLLLPRLSSQPSSSSALTDAYWCRKFILPNEKLTSNRTRHDSSFKVNRIIARSTLVRMPFSEV